MAIMIPSEPKNCTDGSLEKEIFFALEKLPDSYYVFHSFRTLQFNEDILSEHEIDFIIFESTKGILCIEAKAGPVYFDKGYWKRNDYNGNEQILPHGGPFEQAKANKWRLFKLAEKNQAIKSFYKKCKFMEAVWFPSVSQTVLDNKSYAFPYDAVKELVLTQDDLENPREKIDRIFSYSLERTMPQPLTKEEADKFLYSFLCPSAHIVPKTSLEVSSKQMIFHQLLREQVLILDFLDEQNWVAINGAAGTGKTLIAVEKAKRLAELQEKVLFLCVNKELETHLKENYPNDFIDYCTFSGYITKLAGDLKNYKAAAEKLDYYLDHTEAFGYKHIIVDEAQDFGSYGSDYSKEELLQKLNDIIMLNELGCFYVFYDKMQLIQSSKLPAIIENAECRLTLHKNCRNTENIALASLKLLSEEDRLKRLKFRDGINIGQISKMHFLPENKIQEILSDIIENYKKDGVEDIVILSCKKDGDSILEKNNLISVSGQFNERKAYKGIKFSTVRKFKGLEADAVILVDVDRDTLLNKEKNMLYYVGTSRAKIFLDIIVNFSEAECRFILEEIDPKLKSRYPRRDLARFLKCSPREI